MANHASTDEIAMAAYKASTKYWKEFIALPIVITTVLSILFGVIVTLTSSPVGLGSVAFLLMLALAVFWVAFFGAQVKWCEEIHKGAKSIDIQDGLRYGLSRFWGIIGTTLLTMVKTILWMLLLVLPGFYKGLMYSKSVHVSILDKISGGDANRISETVVKKAGPVRTFSNLVGIGLLSTIATYVVMAIALLLSMFFGLVHEFAAAFVFILIYGAGIALVTTVTYVYFHFEYLYFRDEAKAEVTKLKKALS